MIEKIKNIFFNFTNKKAEKDLIKDYNVIIHYRAIDILKEYYSGLSEEDINFILFSTHNNIYFYKACIPDIVKFCNQYDVTVDYMLGRTDDPHFIETRG